MQVLRAVVTSGSVTAAAASLGCTPSAISQQLAALEREAGLPLLEKSGRGVRPTPAGSLLAERAGQVAELLRGIETELAGLRAGHTGQLRVRFFQTASVGLIPPAMAKFRAQHPEVVLDLQILEEGAFREVAEGEADLAVIVAGQQLPQARGVRLIHLADDPFRVVLPADHPQADQDGIDLAELAEENWINTARADHTCAALLADIYACAGFTPHHVLETEDSYAAQAFVAAGLGIALIPQLGLDVVHPGVAVRPIRTPKAVRGVHVAVREAAAGLPATNALVQALVEVAGG